MYNDLVRCVFANDLAALADLLARGADVNIRDEDERTPLIHAAIDGKTEIVKALIAAGADVNVQDAVGFSALHYAAQNQHAQVASLLLDASANVDLVDTYGNSPLRRAVFNSKGRGELVTLLLNAGADREHRNKHGKTPFDLARTIANYDVAQYFK